MHENVYGNIFRPLLNPHSFSTLTSYRPPSPCLFHGYYNNSQTQIFLLIIWAQASKHCPSLPHTFTHTLPTLIFNFLRKENHRHHLYEYILLHLPLLFFFSGILLILLPPPHTCTHTYQTEPRYSPCLFSIVFV